ncbi:maleylpyruvate isomerase family mycothiol-dependent enzyme [Streptomyces albus]|uniref:maleylpyruvate isomerase family mycothiol-dependent enzyme n=1 Tax=Streptomyces albus TaxID=1888 RepID=UPI001FC956B0|nr:maleylpyruvate isomerase family mycothiol-dependent enzyme [Streptomyces albus]
MALTGSAAAGQPGPAAHEPPLAAVLAGHERLSALLTGLTDDDIRAPSALPGWSRAHVLSHIEGIGRALARQARCAVRGELVEVYDGGRAVGRDAAIEAGSSRTAGELRRAVRDALAEAESAWTALGPGDWSLPVRYRDADARAALLAWWRELEIHTADLLLGPGPRDWPRAFCGHALDFLAPRAPAAGLTLAATDGPEERVHGAGSAVPVRGALGDLTAWMAGRAPSGPLDAGDGPLPALGPWP